MDKVKVIKAKIEKAEKLLDEVKRDLEKLINEIDSKKSKAGKKQFDQNLPSEEELRREGEDLYQKFVTAKDGRTEIEGFVKSKTKKYLKAFFKANSLPGDTTKLSKQKIADEIMKWFIQRKAITKKAF